MQTDVLQSCRECVFTSLMFNGLSVKELDFLVDFTSHKHYHRGETVFEQGEDIQYITFLKKGLLKVFKYSPEDKDQIISIAKPNDCVGLLSVFSNTHYQYSITALEDSDIYRVELAAVKHILRNNGEFGIKLLGRISQAADTIISNIYSITKKNIRGRIAYILLEFAEEVYLKDEFDLPVSRKEIGELIGMTTENVIRIFSEFRQDGILTIQGRTINIKNKSMLETLAKFA